MKKRILAILLVIVTVFGMIPVIAGASETAGPKIKSTNLVLNGILDVNFKVEANGADLTGYKVFVTIADDANAQEIEVSEDNMDGELYVCTAKLPAHRMPETLTAKLMNGDKIVDEKTWTVAGYLERLTTAYPKNEDLKTLADALQNYGAYAAYYAKRGVNPEIQAVEDVNAATLERFQHRVEGTTPEGLATAVALYLDEACDLQVKFNKEGWTSGGYQLEITGQTPESAETDKQVIYTISEMLPQDWGMALEIKVLQNDAAVVTYYYSAMSYARVVLNKGEDTIEASYPGLTGLVKAMYLYQEAAVAFIGANEGEVKYDPIDENDGPAIEFGDVNA